MTLFSYTVFTLDAQLGLHQFRTLVFATGADTNVQNYLSISCAASAAPGHGTVGAHCCGHRLPTLVFGSNAPVLEHQDQPSILTTDVCLQCRISGQLWCTIAVATDCTLYVFVQKQYIIISKKKKKKKTLLSTALTDERSTNEARNSHGQARRRFSPLVIACIIAARQQQRHLQEALK